MRNEAYRFKLFEKYNKLAHGISSKAFGSMKKDANDVDRDKLAAFAKSIGIHDDVVCMRQIHSSTIRVVEDTSYLRIPQTDGLITDKKNVPLAVLTADCLPVLFYDPKREVIGVTHAGYKGLLSHVIENSIRHFTSDFKSDPKDIIVGIGPCIERDCYEVTKDRIKEFQKVFPTFENMFFENQGKFYINLREVARQCLIKEGILEEHIEVMDICTKCDKHFYSFRRGDTFERFISVMSLA